MQKIVKQLEAEIEVHEESIERIREAIKVLAVEEEEEEEEEVLDEYAPIWHNSTKEVDKRSKAVQLAEALKEYPGEDWTIAEVRDVMTLDGKALSNVLSAAVRSGLIQRAAKGVYRHKSASKRRGRGGRVKRTAKATRGVNANGRKPSSRKGAAEVLLFLENNTDGWHTSSVIKDRTKDLPEGADVSKIIYDFMCSDQVLIERNDKNQYKLAVSA